jgi:hypothetical protein
VAIDERKFWLFDSNPDGEIYENLSWDLPGYRIRLKAARAGRRRRAKERKQP